MIDCLAVQGSGDTVNPPADTRAVFGQVTSPRYLLTLTRFDRDGRSRSPRGW